jgi:small-conductance mechanosensitive channel
MIVKQDFANTASFRKGIHFLVFFLLLVTASNLPAQQPEEEASDEIRTAVLSIDGNPLTELRGIKSFPASDRVKLVRDRIIALARDESFDVDDLVLKDEDSRVSIYAGDTLVVAVFDVDAELEGVDKKLLAEVLRVKIISAIVQFRNDRSPAVLLTRSAYALGLTGAVFLLLWGIIRLFRWLDGWAVRHVQKSLDTLASKSHSLIHGGQIWSLFAGFLRGLRFFVVIIVLYFYLNTLLGLYPWTRPAALILFELILNPVRSLWLGFLRSLPNLVFLAILYLVVRYILKLTRTFFKGVEGGRIKLQSFDRDWAAPTYKIVRLLIIAFSLVIAYPYIPGSDSGAFKGISLFLGVIFSLGSSSFIANMMAGMAMTYRGAFKEGDRVRIGDVMGEVKEVKLMITRINTLKNESVVIPNSNILNSNVVNYSHLAKDKGVVVYTTVGIGYDVPWRQVEAMLLLAAERTPGLQKDPAPFVLQKEMGDFAVNYEINAFCKDVSRMLSIKSDLHRSIQDLFNEHGVQIMSPAYEGDPETPKVVPPDQWYAAPASKPKS